MKVAIYGLGYVGLTTAGCLTKEGHHVLGIDVSETNESIDITAELPGLEAKDVQLNLSDNVLSIRGEKKSEHEDRQKDYHLVERSFGSFARSVQLPEGVKAEDVTAEISKGVLRVTVKKPRPKQRKQIEIKAA